MSREIIRNRRRAHSIGCGIALVSAFVLLSGCGGEDSPEPAQVRSAAQLEWESQVGPAWEAYEEGFAAAWDDSCEAVREAVVAAYDKEYAEHVVLDCDIPPPSGYGGAPIQVPADPRAAGYADGVAEACYVPPEIDRPLELDCD